MTLASAPLWELGTMTCLFPSCGIRMTQNVVDLGMWPFRWNWWRLLEYTNSERLCWRREDLVVPSLCWFLSTCCCYCLLLCSICASILAIFSNQPFRRFSWVFSKFVPCVCCHSWHCNALVADTFGVYNPGTNMWQTFKKFIGHTYYEKKLCIEFFVCCYQNKLVSFLKKNVVLYVHFQWTLWSSHV